jgi:hypothetical protein
MTEQDPIPPATTTQTESNSLLPVGSEEPPSGPAPSEIVVEQPAEIPTEELAAVIDIHPPQHGAITRRDFFVHLFIVTLGILIAIGLEQAVEYVHHRDQLAEARRELATEYKINLAVFRTQRAEFNRFIPLLQRDIEILVYLRAHPGAPRNSWPGEFSWYHALPKYVDATWKSIQSTEILTLMPQSEVQRNTTLYDMLRQVDDNEDSTNNPFLHSVSYGFRNRDPASMTPAQLDEAIQSASDLLGLYAKMMNLQINLNARFNDFVPAPTYTDVRKIMGMQSERASDLAEGHKLETQLTDEIARIQAEAENKK